MPVVRIATTALVVASLVMVGVGGLARAEQPPPIHGVTGTVATEETAKDVQQAGRGILGKLARLFGRNRPGPVPSGDAAGEETFAGLNTGAAVSVHYPTAGENLTGAQIDRLEDEGVKRIAAVVTAVNRADRTISIRLEDGTRQTLRLSARAASGLDTADPPAGAVIVFVTDAAGERVVHYFTRVP